MSRCFHYRDKGVWVRLYKTYVRPHLECAVQAWSPWYVKDIEILEKVQRRAVNMVVGLRAGTYEGKLKELNLLSLQERRKRGDMIQVWKYMHGHNRGASDFFNMSKEQHPRVSRHTSKPLNLCRIDAGLEVRKNFFVVRCVDPWNRLPHVIQAEEELPHFKKKLDMHCGSSY